MTNQNDSIEKIIEILKQDEEFINYIANKVLELYPTKIIENYVYNKDEDIDYSEYVIISHVKEILEKINRKPSWLQKKTGIPMSTLRSVVNNTNEISLKNAFKISKAMNMSMYELFSFELKK